MMNSWPFFPQELQHNKQFHNCDITILYYPLTGGEFLSNIISCSDSFYGEDYFTFLEKHYEHSNKDWLSTYENIHHEKIYPAHARYFTFSEWQKKKNIIYINYSLSTIETEWLMFRKNFIKNSVSNDILADLQIKYEKELINYFNQHNVNFFNFPLNFFFSADLFSSEVNSCLSYWHLNTISTKKIKKIWKKWWHLNLEYGKNEKRKNYL